MLQGHFCSTVLKAHLYFLAPRSTLYFLRRVSMLLICPHRDEYIPGGDCSTSAWSTSSLKTWYVFLSNFVIFLFWSYSHTNYFQSCSVLLKFLPQFFLGVGRIFCLPSYQGECRYHVFNVFYVYSHFLMYLLHQMKLRACKWHILSTY